MSKEIEEKEYNKLVIYTDGGARPNPGSSGYGIHFCILTNKGKPKLVLGNNHITDMGYKTKTEYKANQDLKLMVAKGYTDIIGFDKRLNTNNMAELQAIITALEKATEVADKHDAEIEDILILSDSTYSINYVNKILNDTLSINEVTINKDLVIRLAEIVNAFKHAFNIKIDKVLAHDVNVGNNKADALATMGIFRNKDVTVTDIKQEKVMHFDDKYWSDVKIDVDTFYFKQLFNFFPENQSKNKVYYGVNYKELSDFGKHINYITYTLVNLREGDELINDILKIIRDTLGTHHVPYVINLRNLLSKDILRDYFKYGKDFLRIIKRPFLSLMTINNIEVARELNPPGLSAMLMENMLGFEEELADYVNGTEKEKIEYIDITDMIYTSNAKGKCIIQPELINDKVKIEYKADTFKLKIHMNSDLPPRNTLKRFESKTPKVILVIKDRGPLIEYFTIVNTNDDDYIFSASLYANKIVKKMPKKKK